MDDKKTIDGKIIEENFVKWKIPRPTQDYMVVVHCSTYNHGKYIEDAIKGFVMQQTDFPFCAIIIDDGSTDDAPNIIRRYAENYPEIIKPILLGENHMQYGKSRNPYFDEWHNAAKYIAFCEGDDYWTDSLKLQRQVDFLEEHEDYSLSSENGVIEFLSTQTTALFNEEETRDVSFEELLIKRRFPTASVVYRKSCIKGYEKLVPPRFDTLSWAYLAKQGRVHYNSVVSSVYRRGCGITFSDRIKWAYTVRDFNNSLYKNFEVSDEIKAIRNEDVYNNLINGIIDAKRQNRFSDVIKLSYYGFQIHPKRMIKWLMKKVFGK